MYSGTRNYCTKEKNTHVRLDRLVHGERLVACANVRGRHPCLAANRGARVRRRAFLESVPINKVRASELDRREDGRKESEEAARNQRGRYRLQLQARLADKGHKEAGRREAEASHPPPWSLYHLLLRSSDAPRA